MKLLAKYYDLIWKLDDLQIVKEYIEETGGDFLDLGSGTGRALSLAQGKSFSAYGIDNNKDMVDISKEKYKEFTNIHTIPGNFCDAHQLLGDLKFGVISCLANTFTMLASNNEMDRVFKECTKLLAQKGKLIIWNLNDNNLPPTESKKIIADRVEYHSTSIRNMGEKYCNITATISCKEGQETNNFRTWLLSTDEVIEMAERHGFKLEYLWGDLNKEEYCKETSPYQFFVFYK